MCKYNDVILLQETWLCEFDLAILNTISEEHYVKGITSVNIHNGIINGRPHGGLAILWRKTLGNTTKPIVYEEEQRIMGLEIKGKDDTLLILNIYMPYCSSDNYEEFIAYLAKTNFFIESANTPTVMAIGDFNADLSRDQRFGKELLHFTDE